MATHNMQLDSPETALGFLLNQLGGLVHHHTARVLQPLGMSPRSFGLLLAVNDEPGASQIALSRRLAVDRTTMSQLVDELTRAGLIKRSVAAEDRRSHKLALTAKGVKTLDRAVLLASDVERAVARDIGDRKLAALKRSLLELLISARGHSDSGA